jgi:hypothetical protein
MGLTERICQLAERGEEKVADTATNLLEGVESIGDDIYLDYTKKTDESMYCHICDLSDNIPVGENVYLITGSVPPKDGTVEEPVEPIVFCPRHMTDLAEQLLLHIVRVGKGKENGAIKLPLRMLDNEKGENK